MARTLSRRTPFPPMPLSWTTLSLLGDSRLLLPTAAVLVGIGACQQCRWAVRWAMALSVLGLVVLASKLAFLGWGIGVPALDFTGFSGHAALSAAVWPVVGHLLGRGGAARRWAVAAGVALAAAIGVSRLPLNAHSWSEVTGGWLIGACAAACALASPAVPRLRARWVALAIAAGGGVLLSLPEVRTHQGVVALAKALSGSKEAFDRRALHRRSTAPVCDGADSGESCRK